MGFTFDPISREFKRNEPDENDVSPENNNSILNFVPHLGSKNPTLFHDSMDSFPPPTPFFSLNPPPFSMLSLLSKFKGFKHPHFRSEERQFVRRLPTNVIEFINNINSKLDPPSLVSYRFAKIADAALVKSMESMGRISRTIEEISHSIASSNTFNILAIDSRSGKALGFISYFMAIFEVSAEVIIIVNVSCLLLCGVLIF